MRTRLIAALALLLVAACDGAIQGNLGGPLTVVGQDQPDLGGKPLPADLAMMSLVDLTTSPDLTPPPIADGMDCSGVPQTYVCNAKDTTLSCSMTGMVNGACQIVCGNSKYWRVAPPTDPAATPDNRFWLNPQLHLKLFGSVRDCM